MALLYVFHVLGRRPLVLLHLHPALFDRTAPATANPATARSNQHPSRPEARREEEKTEEREEEFGGEHYGFSVANWGGWGVGITRICNNGCRTIYLLRHC